MFKFLKSKKSSVAEEKNQAVDQAKSDTTLQQEPTSEQEVPSTSWLTRLRKGLSRTGQNIGGIFSGARLDEDLYEELETALIMADAGMEATTSLLKELRSRVRKNNLSDV